MKAVLLAAGRGSRLRHLTIDTPKPLMSVGNETCIDIVLRALNRVASEVIIVTGFQSEKIVQHLKDNPPKLPYKIVINPNPEKGNLTSLQAARQEVEGEDFLLTNADHLFPENFYTEHFYALSGISVAGENDREILDDEMKTVVDENNHLKAMSKTLPVFGGTYIGTTRVPKACSDNYWAAFDHIHATSDLTSACVEMVLDHLASIGEDIEVTWVKNVNWFEVDTPEDLNVAREGLVAND
jgi:choline kinase